MVAQPFHAGQKVEVDWYGEGKWLPATVADCTEPVVTIGGGVFIDGKDRQVVKLVFAPPNDTVEISHVRARKDD